MCVGGGGGGGGRRSMGKKGWATQLGVSVGVLVQMSRYQLVGLAEHHFMSVSLIFFCP